MPLSMTPEQHRATRALCARENVVRMHGEQYHLGRIFVYIEDDESTQVVHVHKDGRTLWEG